MKRRGQGCERCSKVHHAPRVNALHVTAIPMHKRSIGRLLSALESAASPLSPFVSVQKKKLLPQ
jgi:hypothetical protein